MPTPAVPDRPQPTDDSQPAAETQLINDPLPSTGQPPTNGAPATGSARRAAAAPGGVTLAVAKRAVELGLWTRVSVQRRVPAGAGGVRPLMADHPDRELFPPTAVLRSRAEWQLSVALARRARLPLHHDRPKNWDALGAVRTVLAECGPSARVLDAGSARYSPVLPWLRLYGLTDLVGNNLEFGDEVRRDGVRFRYGDITATDFPDGRFDAVTCMSVIEHGVDVPAFLAEGARILRPGGILVISTDYDADPPDTAGIMMYGQPVHIFSPDEIRELVVQAEKAGLNLLGELALEHAERPVHWDRTGLDYTFIRLTFRKA